MAFRFPWVLATAALLVGTYASGQTQPSYEATITAAQAFALSGDGIGYYPTAALPMGSKVTVVGGKIRECLPIQPPKGSFSWVPADAVEERADGMAVVVKDDVQVRVGSTLSDAHHVFQVTLKKGDRLHILDQAPLKDDGQIKDWYKILPPKDEIRYVAASQVQTPGSAESTVTSRTAERPNLTMPPPAIPSQTAVVGGRPVGTRLIPPAPHVDKTPTVLTASRAVSDAEPPIDWIDDPKLPVATRVKKVRNYLKILQTQPPTQWNLTPLQTTIDDMLSTVKDPREKSDVLDLREQLNKLADLKERYDGSARRRDLTLRRDQELDEMLQRKQRQLVGSASRFHAQGVLTEAALAIDGKTTYSIENDKGIVTQYIIPAPGLNIGAYVGKSVGLFGTTQRRKDLPPILTATQLVPIEDPPGEPR